MKHPLHTCSVLALALAAGHAQTLLQDYSGTQPVQELGQSVAGGADLDADGWDDVIVGSPFESLAGQVGVVRVLSGRTRGAIHTWTGASTTGLFGFDVSLAGDVDGDGVEDVIVGAPAADDPAGTATGLARVFSGGTGAVLHTAYGQSSYGFFGWSVSGGLDHDGDGRAEFAVGAPGENYLGSIDRGTVRVFDGATGALLDTSTSTWNTARWGESIWARSDVDGDGVLDLVVGAPLAGVSLNGEVQVISGATLQPLWAVTGSDPYGRLGSAVSAGLDVNLDGAAEVLAGAPYRGSSGEGALELRDGPTGSLRHTWQGNAGTQLGVSAAVIGDVDADGVHDVVMGLLYGGPFNQGGVIAASGASGAILFTLTGPSSFSLFGSDVASAGDFNLDGAPDFVVGAPWHDVIATDEGTAMVFSGGGPGIVTYCTPGTSASGCSARIGAVGVPSASAPSGFQLRATDVEGDKNGIFFYGANGRQMNTWGNGTSYQCVVPPVKRGGLVSGGGTPGLCDGQFALDLNARWCAACPKPAHNFGAGALVQAQLWYRDPQNTSNQTTSLSDAVEFVMQP